jgi:hypothetical protein
MNTDLVRNAQRKCLQSPDGGCGIRMPTDWRDTDLVSCWFGTKHNPCPWMQDVIEALEELEEMEHQTYGEE